VPWRRALTGIAELESNQRGDQREAHGTREENHDIVFEDARPDPPG